MDKLELIHKKINLKTVNYEWLFKYRQYTVLLEGKSSEDKDFNFYKLRVYRDYLEVYNESIRIPKATDDLVIKCHRIVKDIDTLHEAGRLDIADKERSQ